MNPLWKLKVLQIAAQDIIRGNFLHVGMHIETEKNRHVPSHRNRWLALFYGSQRCMADIGSFAHDGGWDPAAYASKLQILP